MEEINTLRNEDEIQKLIKIFAEKTSCKMQHNNSPCNTCFHSIDETIDFRHICWLMLLGLRGDYESKEILKAIRKEIK